MKINNINSENNDFYKSEFFSFSLSFFFIIILSFYLGLLYYSNSFFLTDSLFYNSYSGSITTDSITNIIGVKNKFLWVSYFIFPIILIIKLFFSSICIKTRLVLFEVNLKWQEIFNIVIFSELVFVLSALVKVIVLTFKKINILEDIQLYTPLSLYGLVKNTSIIPQFLIIPLQTINFFEISYWFLLSFGLSVHLKMKFANSFIIVLSSYCIGLLFWSLFLMFITILYT